MDRTLIKDLFIAKSLKTPLLLPYLLSSTCYILLTNEIKKLAFYKRNVKLLDFLSVFFLHLKQCILLIHVINQANNF